MNKSALCGVYKITSPSGRVYVGSSNDIKKRWRNYRWGKGCQDQIRLYSSFQKYGVKAHEFKILVLCDISRLYEFEAAFGAYYNVLNDHVGMNCNLPAAGEFRQTKSDETKKKHALAMSMYKWSDETREKFKNAMANRTHEQKKESGALISKALKNKPKTAEHNRKVSEAHKSIILNTQTGIYYLGIKEGADSVGLSHSAVRAMLANQNYNYTHLKRV